MKCYDSGTILEEDVLGISPDEIIQSFQKGAMNIAAASFELGIPTAASIDIMMGNAIKNIAAISAETGLKVPGLVIGECTGPAPAGPAKT